MKIKKFTANSMPEAMKTVRNELGNNAVILNSRTVYTGGFLGFFRKKNIEVIAAIDQKAEKELTMISKEKAKNSLQMQNQQSIPIPQAGTVKKEKQRGFDDNKQNTDLLKEIASLKELIQNQSLESTTVIHLFPEPVRQIETLMNKQEFSSLLKKQMTTALMEKWFLEGSKSTTKEMMDFFEKELVQFLSKKACGGISFNKKYVTVVGPTGVGKTTTLAKLAADCLLNHEKRVAFITTDTYRIAAIEQLKTYAQILNAPIEVCYNPEDFQAAKEKFSSYDLVFIDTAGRNFRNKQYVEDLQKIIDFNNEYEVFLVLALTAKPKDMEVIARQFSSIPISKFIFTKADETSVYGSMFNLMEQFDKGVAYITTGQNVPDDVEKGSPGTLSKLLIGAK